MSDAGSGAVAGAGASGFAGQSVAELLSALAARTPAPGGGSAAAVVVAMAAALSGMAARYSDGRLEAAGDIAEAADRCAARALRLAEEDAGAYGALLTARRPPESDRSGASIVARSAAIDAALAKAIAIPVEIAELASEVGRLAGALLADGNRNLAGDARTAGLLAEAAGAAALMLAELNRADGGAGS
ncbi:MAG: cyclodeaminase/cyclohydrolase family protein [Acidimicrobiales bacterium]